MTSVGKKPPGFNNEFMVQHVGGRDFNGAVRLRGEYVVLDVAYCRYARKAAVAYADILSEKYPEAAEELRAKIASLPPVPLEPWQRAIIEEKVALDEKIRMLQLQIENGAQHSHPEMQRLLAEQLGVMSSYSSILGAQIALFTDA